MEAKTSLELALEMFIYAGSRVTNFCVAILDVPELSKQQRDAISAVHRSFLDAIADDAKTLAAVITRGTSLSAEEEQERIDEIRRESDDGKGRAFSEVEEYGTLHNTDGRA